MQENHRDLVLRFGIAAEDGVAKRVHARGRVSRTKNESRRLERAQVRLGKPGTDLVREAEGAHAAAVLGDVDGCAARVRRTRRSFNQRSGPWIPGALQSVRPSARHDGCGRRSSAYTRCTTDSAETRSFTHAAPGASFWRSGVPPARTTGTAPPHACAGTTTDGIPSRPKSSATPPCRRPAGLRRMSLCPTVVLNVRVALIEEMLVLRAACQAPRWRKLRDASRPSCVRRSPATPTAGSAGWDELLGRPS